MVRKRSRKYESEDNDSDSDIDFAVNQPTEPAPKKYSLRERKGTSVFTSDFDYYGLDEEEGEPRNSSEDEDFEVESEAEGLNVSPPVPGTLTANSTVSQEVGPQNSEGLIDFEDIIRADIVMNKNKIDYDNLIQKTEIKLIDQPKRRGRKPKHFYAEPVEPEQPSATSIFEPEVETLTQLENQVDNPNGEVPVPEINFCEEPLPTLTVDTLNNSDNSIKDDSVEAQSQTDPLALANKHVAVPETISKPPEPQEDDFLKEAADINDEDDDVIVLGELKQDIIVLDD